MSYGPRAVKDYVSSQHINSSYINIFKMNTAHISSISTVYVYKFQQQIFYK